MVRVEPSAELISSAHSSIVETLRLHGDSKTAEAQFQYMKGVVRFHGIKAPALKALFRGLSPLWKAWDEAGRVELAWRLLRSEYFEEKDCGISVLKPLAPKLGADWLRTMEASFETIVNGWATCDTLCGSVFRALLPRAELRTRLVGWKDSPNPWMQRAAAVSFVNEARHGGYNAEILEVCATTVRNPHRFVQLGTGWALRELSLADRGLVDEFVHGHRAFFIAEGLRYALEKYPPDERRRLLEGGV